MRPRLPSRLPEKRAAARPSRALLSIALLLLASSPSLVESSRARRRHPSSFHTENVNKPRGYDHKPSPVSSGLTREESSIPGVSIWTSKKAAGAGDFAVRPRISKDTGRGSAKVKDFKTVRGQRQTHGGERDSFLGGCQVRLRAKPRAVVSIFAQDVENFYSSRRIFCASTDTCGGITVLPLTSPSSIHFRHLNRNLAVVSSIDPLVCSDQSS